MKKQKSKPKTKNPNNLQPIYFSDYFKIDKKKLKKLGVFDPIINFDTALFVEPLLLKQSSSEIIKNSTKTYNEYFLTILRLLRASKIEGDIAWQGAKKLINFPEYQYTCIGYAGISNGGSGLGRDFNEKILMRAKEMIEISRDEPEILPFLALLEDGIAGDRISDMTQKIIDKEICEYTVDIMKKIDFQGELRQYETERYERYYLPYNPYSKCALKLLPQDILSNLPLADSFDTWTLEVVEHNARLRNRINQDLGEQWRDATKTDKKEAMLKKIKEDEEFFLEVVKALKESSFKNNDIEADAKGLYRWLEDSKQFINLGSLQVQNNCEDTLEAISLQAELIVNHFQQLIENKGLWRMFWAKINKTDVHVNEIYSQMLFYVVCNSWLKSQNSNIKLFIEYNKERKIDFKFSISDKINVFVVIKHADNKSLEKIYKKQLEKYENQKNAKCLFTIVNFREEVNTQFKDVRLMRQDYCKVLEVHCLQVLSYDKPPKTQNKNINNDEFEYNFADVNISIDDIDLNFDDIKFDIPTIEFEDMPKIIDNTNYIKGANKKNEDTNIVKTQIIKPMFLHIQKEGIMKGKTYNVADISRKIINQFNTKSQESLMREYNFKDITTLKKAIQYNNNKAGGQIESWCYKINKKEF